MSLSKQSRFPAIVLFSLLSSSAFSAEFSVNTVLDSIDTNPGDGVCSTTKGQCSLRAAVMESNALAGADIINVPANSYPLVVEGDVQDDPASVWDLDISDDLTIIGEDHETTIISGNFNATRIFEVLKRSDNSRPKVIFKNLTLTKGKGTGAVLHNSGIATLDNVTITDASSDSSAIYNTHKLTVKNSRINNSSTAISSTYRLTIEDSEIKDNYRGVVSSSNSRSVIIKGSLFENNIGERALYSKATYTIISNTTFSSNTLFGDSGGVGGAAYFNGGTITIDDSNFVGNKAENGGAIYSSGYLTITSSFFSNNSTTDSLFGFYRNNGGALYLKGQADIVGGSFLDNTAFDHGGAIYSINKLTLERVTMSNNSVTYNGSSGGAIYSSANFSVVESVLANNSAKSKGGAIMIGANRSSMNRFISYSQISGNSANSGGGIYTTDALTILNSTISGNTALDGGGGLANFGNTNSTVTLTNTTLASNRAQLGANIINYGSSGNKGRVRLNNVLLFNPLDSTNCLGSEIISTGYNLDTDDSCGLTEIGDLPNANADLGLLADNGGFTKTHALGSNSDAIDAGNPNVCLNNPALDQRYHYRNDSQCDIGAFEYGSTRAESGILAFSSAETTGNEELGTVSVTVSRTGGNEGPVSVNVYSTIFGTASLFTGGISNNGDFRYVNMTLEWEDGDDEDKIVTITLINDSRVEGTEEFNLKLRRIKGGALMGEQVNHAVRILDDEAKPGTLAFLSSTAKIDESRGTATFTVLRTQGDFGTVSVDYVTQNGTATHDADYSSALGTLTFLNGEKSKTISVDIIDDELTEPTETFRLVLSNPLGGATLGSNSSVDAEILDNDTFPGEINIKQANYIVSENGGVLAFTLLRTNGTDGEVSVNIKQNSGTADYGSDFGSFVGVTGRGANVMFADGKETANIEIEILDDSVVEGDETFNMVLSQPNGGVVLGSVKTATVTIIDDESSTTGAAGRISFGNEILEVYEYEGDVTITVNRNGGSAGTASVNYTIEAVSAEPGSDYSAIDSGTIIFSDAEISKAIIVDIIDDEVFESNEIFTLTLNNPVGATLSSTNTKVTVKINDDDEGPGVLALNLTNITVSEVSGKAIIQVDRVNGSTGEVSVDIATINNSAISGNDFKKVSQTLIFLDGEISKSVEVEIINDSSSESEESFSIQISNPTNGALLDTQNSTSTVTILDDDQTRKAEPSSGGSGGGAIHPLLALLFVFIAYMRVVQSRKHS